MLIKKSSQKVLSRLGKGTGRGGNRKKQTFKVCEVCNKEFGPVSHLKRKTCSVKCRRILLKTGKTRLWKSTTKAASARTLLHYHVVKGHIIKPQNCEQCGKEGKIEGAHFDYNQPLKVRWLCISCHRKWDWKEKKNGAFLIILDRWEKHTGQKAAKIV